MTPRAVWKHHRRLGYWSPLGDYTGKYSRVQRSGRKYAVYINDKPFTTRPTAEAAMQAADEVWDDLRRRSPDDPAAALPQLGLGDRPSHARKRASVAPYTSDTLAVSRRMIAPGPLREEQAIIYDLMTRFRNLESSLRYYDRSTGEAIAAEAQKLRDEAWRRIEQLPEGDLRTNLTRRMYE